MFLEEDFTNHENVCRKFNRAVERFMNFVSVSNHSVVFGFIDETDLLHKHGIALHDVSNNGK